MVLAPASVARVGVRVDLGEPTCDRRRRRPHAGRIPAALGKGVVGGWPFAAHNGYYEIVLGVGYLGLALFVAFLAVALWRAFQYAWHRRDVESLWPLTFIVFAVVVNFSESLWCPARRRSR